ncbi:unnamed protein product [Plasmodium vivax]|nr:unnamed protein product [Plasmodium vivax]CAI7720139.1 CS domain-containing protein, putative [Plasmodium vivax]
MNRLCLLVAICLALSHSSKSVTDHHTAGIRLTLQRRCNVCVKTRRGKSHQGGASPPWNSPNCKQIRFVKRPAKRCRYLFCKPSHPHGRKKAVPEGGKQPGDAHQGGNKAAYFSTEQSGGRRYYKGGYHAGKTWSIFALHEGGAGGRGGMRRQRIGGSERDDCVASKLGADNLSEEDEPVRGESQVEEANRRGVAPQQSEPHREGGTPHQGEENLSEAMQRAERYIKGKEDDVLERREQQKKKKVAEKLKGQEDAFTDKFLNLGMYDVLKHVYEGGLYADSRSLVEAVCRWMRRAYTGGAERSAEREAEKSSPGVDNSPPVGSSPPVGTSPRVDYLVEKDLADSYSPDGGEKVAHHFHLDPPGEKKGSAQMEPLKLYNKKNLKKYFFSLNGGNILKQLVSEGEDEVLDPTEGGGSPQKGDLSKGDLAKRQLNERVKTVLSSNSILSCDYETYVDGERYMQSNVTVEFNLYDTFSDRVVLNNQNTNSTMLEFPLMYSHQIVQKCILTMKKLEKAIFYINNSFLFGLFSPREEEPMSEEDRRVYDVITNESWVKMEIYLCNIYRMDEKWLGITPETFADEASASSFLQAYSGGGNLVCQPGGGAVGGSPSTSDEKRPGTADEEQPSTLNGEKPAALGEDPPATPNEDAAAANATATAATAATTERRAEIARRREEYESKKDIAAKSQLLMEKLENEMKYNPNHYMWRDLYPQLDERGRERTEKYFKNFQKEMSENKCSRGYTDNIKKKQQLKGYDIGEKIEGRAKHYVWQETIHSFVLYFPLRPYVNKGDITIDIDSSFFFLSIRGHTIVKDFFIKPVNAADSIWSLTDREDDVVGGRVSTHKRREETTPDEFPLLEISHAEDSEVHKMMKRRYCLVYNIYKDNNHRYMWGSIFKAS